MKPHDRVRLRHILDAATKALSFVKDLTKDDFYEDEQLPFSLTRLLEIIGEAAKAVSDETQHQYPDIEWKAMAGMRDCLIHGYYDVNLDIVWETVTHDLPSLIQKIQKILESDAEPQPLS